MRPFHSSLSVLVVTLALLFALSPSTRAQDRPIGVGEEGASTVESAPTLRPVRTDSPRDTLATFLRLRDELEAALLEYSEEKTTDGAIYLALLSSQLRTLLDLSEIPLAARNQVADDMGALLLDILGRVELPNLGDVPDAETSTDGELAQYRIPKTPIRIARIAEGQRQGEYLFSAQTVQAAPRFFQGIEDMPLQSALEIESWSRFLPQVTGPWIPAAIVRAIPTSLHALWLSTPIWKIIATTLAAVIAVLLLARLHRWLAQREFQSRIRRLCWRLIRPISIILMIVVVGFLANTQINIYGAFSALVDTIIIVILYVAFAWVFWLVSRLFFEWLILSPHIPDESLDANLLRVVGGAVGVVGATIILAFGGQALGLPVLSVLAGLGIGGVAVALAVRPTLENLIGGIILYMDKPIRVGDFCSFGDKVGTVEAIGIRSTHVRGLDRTLVAVPNAQFADMEIVNWARCDEMLINEVIGLRYETTPDQLRYFLATLRQMLHGHPRINSETVRARFSGYGDSSLNVTIRVYAKTREWNDFHAIREDILLRVYDLVIEAGTSFAFPSRTIYMGKDEGLDTDMAETAEERVKAWRRTGQLPFPRFAPETLERVDDTLDYPPKGSPEAGHEDMEAAASSESLSALPLPGEEANEPADGDEEAQKKDQPKPGEK